MIGDVKIKALIDTGANCSIIKESITKTIECNLKPISLKLNGIGNGSIHVIAMTTFIVRSNNINIELDAYVARDSDFNLDFLIGRNVVDHPDIEIITNHDGCKLSRKITLSNVYLVSSIETEDSHISELRGNIAHLNDDLQKQIIALFRKYPNVLNELGTVLTGELKLRLKSDSTVYYRPYRMAPVEREKINYIIKDLLDKNIIKDSDSPFASPVLLVKKKDGNDRMCVDYRALNKIIEKDRFPLPLIEDQVDKLGKAKYYISIDMKNGFYQIPVSPDSRKYTAFVTPDGHYEFLKMPFGICNGPSVFQRAITKAVQHLKFLLVYIDDILIPFTNIDEGLHYLDETLSALCSAGFTVNLKKCKFFVDSVEYLGRHISQAGVSPSDAKVSALVNSPVPTTVKQVRQFMGLASYFRKYIPDFATRTASITKLTKNNIKWEWGPEQDTARNYVIKQLISKPLLSIFDPSLPTELHTDASALGYGAILLQKLGNSNKVVGYFSKRTSPAESKYCSYDLETLAIYNALKHFRVYLLGMNFKIITDCNAIKSTMSKKDLSPRVARWWTFLQDFQFEIIYKKGKFISHVDFLSRNPVESHVLSETANLSIFPNDINAINDPPCWLEVAQRNDPETQNLIESVNTGNIDTNRYQIRDNLLIYKSEPDLQPRFYVPKGYRLNILRLFHDENCHVGFDKTLHKVREHFWFPGMTTFVQKYLSHCLVCIKRKGHSGPKQGLLHPIEKTAVPFHTVHLDCTGPFSASSEGHKHVLLLVDGFTKFCLLKPLKTLRAQELIPIIRETITMFGTPSLVVTDQGSNFTSNEIRNLFQELQIEHHMIATGTPRGNGQVERYVATVINMLNTLTSDDNMLDWPNGLWKVQQSINTTIQRSTGFSPLRLLIGVDANIPGVQARLDDIVGDNPLEININTQADRELAQQRLTNIAQRFKQRFDITRRNNKVFKIGDTVFVNQNHRRHDKLQAKYKGPYIIISAHPHDRYRLRGSGTLRNIMAAKEKLRFWPGEWLAENAVVEDAL